MVGLAMPLGLMLAASTAADTITTRQALNNCNICREGNPIMRPFAGNTAALTTVQAFSNLGIFALSYHYREHHRKTWWIPVAAYIGLHTYAAYHNSKAPTIRRLP